MSEPFIGEIKMFAGNFAIRSWAFCDGQLLSVGQNEALFSLLGTNYGGDGRTTFGLPDLRGRIPVHAGQGPGLSNHPIGQKSGSPTASLTSQQAPSHTHTLQGSTGTADTTDPTGALPAKMPDDAYSPVGTPVAMHPDAIVAAGGSQPHDNTQPFLCVNFIIALHGVYPSRN